MLLFAAGIGAQTAVAATLAGAAAIVDKSSPARELLETIRTVGAGERALPAITPGQQRRAAARLGSSDRAIFAMRLAGTSSTDIAAVVGLGTSNLRARRAAIVAVLGTRSDPVSGSLRKAA